MGKKQKYPVLLGFPQTDRNQLNKVWCPYCNEWHNHGNGNGHKISHCKNWGNGTPFEKGYEIKRISKKDAKQLIKALEIYVNNKRLEET